MTTVQTTAAAALPRESAPAEDHTSWRWWILSATPIAAPRNGAASSSVFNNSASPTPSIASQIAGR